MEHLTLTGGMGNTKFCSEILNSRQFGRPGHRWNIIFEWTLKKQNRHCVACIHVSCNSDHNDHKMLGISWIAENQLFFKKGSASWICLGKLS
jgi:hypothetical protein